MTNTNNDEIDQIIRQGGYGVYVDTVRNITGYTLPNISDRDLYNAVYDRLQELRLEAINDALSGVEFPVEPLLVEDPRADEWVQVYGSDLPRTEYIESTIHKER